MLPSDVLNCLEFVNLRKINSFLPKKFITFLRMERNNTLISSHFHIYTINTRKLKNYVDLIFVFIFFLSNKDDKN